MVRLERGADAVQRRVGANLALLRDEYASVEDEQAVQIAVPYLDRPFSLSA